MKLKKQVIQLFKDRVPMTSLAKWVGASRSSLYYRNKSGKRGRKPTTVTEKADGSVVSNQHVINTLVNEVYGAHEFNRYGYILSTCELRSMGFKINPKKVYRLMKESGLLLSKIKSGPSQRQWVQWRKIEGAMPLDYICMDIKHVYIHDEKRFAYLLAIIDVATRYVLSWSLRYTMKHSHVIMCLHEVVKNYPSKEIMLRTDNGSQFIANGLKEYLEDKNLTHEFTHVATPEENSYVESLFSNVEREVIKPHQFESLYDAKDVFDRYFKWYNTKRRHHGIGRVSPLEYWQTRWPCHPVRPPIAMQNFSEQDFLAKNTTSNEVEIFCQKPEGLRSWNEKGCKLNLPEQVDNKNVLN